MSNRVKHVDLVQALEQLKSAAQNVGIEEAARWNLEIGSKTYGRAYRLWLQLKNPEHTGHYTPIVQDYLGMTAGEALETMNTMKRAFLAVLWSKRE